MLFSSLLRISGDANNMSNWILTIPGVNGPVTKVQEADGKYHFGAVLNRETYFSVTVDGVLTDLTDAGFVSGTSNLRPVQSFNSLGTRLVSSLSNSNGGRLIRASSDLTDATLSNAKTTSSFLPSSSYLYDDGSLLIAGYPPLAGFGFEVMKLSSDLSTAVWYNTYTPAGVTTGPPPKFNSLHVDSMGGIYVRGNGSNGSIVLDFILKLNSDGTVAWVRSQTGPSGATLVVATPIGHRLTLDDSDNVYVIGSESNTTMYLIKYNSSGSLQWSRKITAPNYINSQAVHFSAGYVYSTFHVQTISGGVFIFKHTLDGELVYQRRLSSSTLGTSETMSISSTTDGSSLLVAVAGQYSTSASKYLTLCKLPEDGTGVGVFQNFTYQESSLSETAGTVVSVVSSSGINAATASLAAGVLPIYSPVQVEI